MTLQIDREEGLYLRQTLFDRARRVIIKVGSAVLTRETGLNKEVIEALARQISFLRESGREVILVSSGAVAAGRQTLGVARKDHEELRLKQALAATGQGLLMQAYEQAFSPYNQKVAQILLTHDDVSHRKRYLNVRNTILTLFDFGVVPVINENDTVSREELRFSDNDTLAALITNMIGADMLIILSDVDGLFTANPGMDATARPVYTVLEITEEIEQMASHSTSSLGTGGMLAKIHAAKMVALSGGSSFIGPGRNKNILQELFSGATIGTFFLPARERITRRKHWIAYVLRPEGTLILDDGASRALVMHGKSLLPSGILNVQGEFDVGAPVQCVDSRGQVIASGLTNYCSGDIIRIMGLKSSEIASALGHKDCDEVIHRDNLVLGNRSQASRM
ncbi:MAG: glutamate 5-kinase [Desulfobulbus propionicus]|nr:MAG: glutamate 5-kinase [Desulfobulbus propionicus]